MLLVLTLAATLSAQAAEPVEPSAEEVTRLLVVLADQKGDWISADFALARSKDERIVPAYIELLSANLFEKEDDGSRAQYGLMTGGRGRGCVIMPFLYGQVLADRLGRLGDRRAIPVLWEAVAEGGNGVPPKAHEALYRLGAISLDDLFGMARGGSDRDMSEIIGSVAREAGWEQPLVALRLYGRVLAELAANRFAVASAHYSRSDLFRRLGRYDEAQLELDALLGFVEFENLTSQVPKLRAQIEALRAQPR